MATSGAKLQAWKGIMMGLRNSVRDHPEKPRLEPLKALQEAYLLDTEQIQRYVIHKNPCQLSEIQCGLAEYLLFKTKGKPQRYTVEKLALLQRICLLTDEQIKGNVIHWWMRQHKKQDREGK